MQYHYCALRSIALMNLTYSVYCFIRCTWGRNAALPEIGNPKGGMIPARNDDLARRDALRQAFTRDLVLVGVVVPFLYVSRRLRGDYSGSLKTELQIMINREGGKRC